MAVDPAKILKLAKDFQNGKLSSGSEEAPLSIEEMDALLEHLDGLRAEKLTAAGVDRFKKIA